VVFVLDFCDTPRVLTALDDAAIACLHILLRANDGKWHGGHEASGMLCSGLVILLDGWCVNLDTLRFNDRPDLCGISF
jgi:hypothetical protein